MKLIYTHNGDVRKPCSTLIIFQHVSLKEQLFRDNIQSGTCADSKISASYGSHKFAKTLGFPAKSILWQQLIVFANLRGTQLSKIYLQFAKKIKFFFTQIYVIWIPDKITLNIHLLPGPYLYTKFVFEETNDIYLIFALIYFNYLPNGEKVVIFLKTLFY